MRIVVFIDLDDYVLDKKVDTSFEELHTLSVSAYWILKSFAIWGYASSKICVCVGEYDNHTDSSLALVAMYVDDGDGGGRGYDSDHDHPHDDDEDACDTNTKTDQNTHLQMILHLPTHQLAIQTEKVSVMQY